MKHQETKATKPIADHARSLPPPMGQPSPQQPQDPGRRSVMLPTDPAGQRRVIQETFLSVVGAGVIAIQMQPFVNTDGGKADYNSAATFVAAIKESLHPSDAIEEMLVLQMTWTHARLARLSAIAHQQNETKNVQVVNDACDRAANAFRRQMLALAEYRRPPRTDAFVAIKQANVANQQVVQNAEIRKTESENGSNEQGSAMPKALPAHAEGVDFVAAGRAEPSPVAVEHRAEDGGGEGPGEDERPEAR